jgi:hypothetical protein
MTSDDAIAIILERRGSMYDPHVVDMFLQVYRDIVPKVSERPELQSAVRRIRHLHQPPAPRTADRIRHEELPVADSSDELLAFVSLSRLASRTATVRDVGVMAAGYLRQLAPGATLALLTVDPLRGLLVAQHSVGPAASRTTGLAVEIGYRVSGWVAATWQPMFNAQAGLDLEGAAEDLQYAVSLPLVTDGRLAGVLTLYSAEQFGDLQCRRLEMVTPHLAAALAMVETAAAAPKVARDLRVVARR